MKKLYTALCSFTLLVCINTHAGELNKKTVRFRSDVKGSNGPTSAEYCEIGDERREQFHRDIALQQEKRETAWDEQLPDERPFGEPKHMRPSKSLFWRVGGADQPVVLTKGTGLATTSNEQLKELSTVLTTEKRKVRAMVEAILARNNDMLVEARQVLELLDTYTRSNYAEKALRKILSKKVLALGLPITEEHYEPFGQDNLRLKTSFTMPAGAKEYEGSAGDAKIDYLDWTQLFVTRSDTFISGTVVELLNLLVIMDFANEEYEKDESEHDEVKANIAIMHDHLVKQYAALRSSENASIFIRLLPQFFESVITILGELEPIIERITELVQASTAKTTSPLSQQRAVRPRNEEDAPLQSSRMPNPPESASQHTAKKS